jgi:hypothetical protein
MAYFERGFLGPSTRECIEGHEKVGSAFVCDSNAQLEGTFPVGSLLINQQSSPP